MTAPGDTLGPLEVTLARSDLVRYAGASGDFNPIHWNERFARSVGLPDVIAHGMLTMGIAGRLLTEWAGAGAVLDFGVRFTKPVVVPDDDHGAPVRVAGVVREVRADGTVAVDLTVTSGEVKVLGQARAIVRDPGV